ncbi:MAG: hypothetical protein ACRDIA_07765, partial [Actinomycetota bacterium]
MATATHVDSERGARATHVDSERGARATHVDSERGARATRTDPEERGVRAAFTAPGENRVTAALTTPGEKRDTAARTDLDEIEDLLKRRADALNSKDRTSFLATVDEEMGPFLQAQKDFFERTSSLPLASFRLSLDHRDGPEFTREKDRLKHGPSAVVASVDQSYELQGYDEVRTLRDLTYTFVKKATGWRIASDTDLEELGELTDRELWEFGPVQTRQSPHFMLMFHPSDARHADELLAAAEDALPAVDRVWRRPWSKRVPILVPANRAELVRLLETTFDVSSFVAFAVSSLDRKSDDAWDLGGNRIVLNRENFLRHPVPSRRSILAHELLHIASRGQSGPFTTALVDEGLAQLTGDASPAGLNRRIRNGRFDRRLPKSWEFNTGGRDEIFNAYDESLSAFGYMTEKFGLDGVNRFYEVLGKARIE